MKRELRKEDKGPTLNLVLAGFQQLAKQDLGLDLDVAPHFAEEGQELRPVR